MTKTEESGKKDFWGTPPIIKTAVDRFFKGSWFDPCPWDPNFDGLNCLWPQKAYVNPPFSKYSEWVAKGLKHQGTSLWMTHTKNSTEWFKRLTGDGCVAICLLNKRVNFVDYETKEISKSTYYGMSQCIILSSNEPKTDQILSDFQEAFKGVGKVYIPY